jgi:hypothetical protein
MLMVLRWVGIAPTVFLPVIPVIRHIHICSFNCVKNRLHIPTQTEPKTGLTDILWVPVAAAKPRIANRNFVRSVRATPGLVRFDLVRNIVE